MRLIDADALINRVVFHTDWSSDEKEAFEDEVNSEPTVEPERKTGEWIDGEESEGACNIVYTEHICSECGYSHSFPLKYNFCPECGADMRGDSDEQQ